MAKFMFCVSTNLVGSEIEEVYEIPDDELEGLTEDEKKRVVQEHYDDWLGNHAEFSWWEVDEDVED